MDRNNGENQGRRGRVLGSALAAGGLLVAGAAIEYGVTEYRAAHRSYSDDDQQVQCEKVEIVGSTPESVTYFPVVRALGKVPLAHLYTMAEDNRNFVTDPETGDAINTTERVRSVTKPGIAPIKVSLEDQGNVSISIVVSRQEVINRWTPPGAQVISCPPPSEAVVTDR